MKHFRLIQLHAKDNVAVVLAPADAGAKAMSEGMEYPLIATEQIAFGHKIALQNIGKNQPVIKYGETIGYATTDIDSGSWVHVHNLESQRGR